MADSLGEGSEGGILDQSLTLSCSIQKSYQFEVEVWLSRGMLVLCNTGAMSAEINLLQKQGVKTSEKSENSQCFAWRAQARTLNQPCMCA